MADGTLRLRVFAGPNGSGKSTVIDSVRCKEVNGKAIDFGIYINADEIARTLRKTPLRFNSFGIKTTAADFENIALASGLVSGTFDAATFKKCYEFSRNTIRLIRYEFADRMAQITADFLRKTLLAERKKFSFETVFSHPGKLDIMKAAEAAGYKVYLYFVSTETADINVYRVAARKEKGGHDVPEDRIRARYGRSLGLLFEACQIAYQAFFFDNSYDGTDAAMFAHFKKVGDSKQWDDMDANAIPQWFFKYYSEKVTS